MVILWVTMKCKSTVIFSFFFLLLMVEAIETQDETDGPVVNLPQGSVRGHYKKSYKGREYAAFEGIPYAKPPVGELRFKEAEPAESWNETLIADQSYKCPFYLDIMDFTQGDEDCLYMYVYVPKSDTITGDEQYDVVVHIHGGGFMLGSPSLLAGPRFIMDKDVVYVSFNYRLGILGFLSTGDEILPGNNGLKDQVLALKWIKNNIAYFGGNPDSVTLTGVSAGGASVHYHYLSPLSEGLFHRGLSQSGTALQNWALSKKPRKYAQEIADYFGCSLEEIADCLRLVDTTDLVKSVTKLNSYVPGISISPIGPVIEEESENAFLSEHPYELLKSKKIYDVPWITSNTKDEGLFLAMLIKIFRTSENGTVNLDFLNKDEYLLKSLDLFDVLEPGKEQEVIDKIREFYFHNEPITKDNYIAYLTKLSTERAFFLDTDYAIRLHSKAVTSPVYYYLFSYNMEMPGFFGRRFNGSAHGDDTRFLFEVFGGPRTLQENDEKMMEVFTEFLANYAKSGIPTFNDVNWTPLNPNSDLLDYLHIKGPTDMDMETTEQLWVDVEFWKNLPIEEYFNN